MKRILVIYHSQERGNTRKMAELVADGCRQAAGVEVKLIEVFEHRVDMNEVASADGLALGSPDYFTYMAGGLKQFFDDMCLADWAGMGVKEKPFVAFMTHGGGGQGIRSIEELAKAMKLVQAAPSVACKGAPAGAAIEQSVALGRALAQRVLDGRKG
jgi:multimeric flavodoxin WrbA